MGRYASETQVSVEKSRAEIEMILRRYGADQFVSGWDADKAVIGFRAQGRFVRFTLPIPDRNAREFTHTDHRGMRRSAPEQEKAWEAGCRQRWRALALVIKAKLEAVEAGITTFEDEFLAHITLPGGQSVGAWLKPQIAEAYESGKVPPMLLELKQ